MDMRTDLIAVPHAGLGFHFLRVQVGKSKEEEEVYPAEGPKVIYDRADDRVTTVRGCQWSSQGPSTQGKAPMH